MLKRLVRKYFPIAIFVFLVVAILSMSRYAEHRKAENQEYAQSSSPQPAISPNDAAKGAKITNKAKYPPSWIDTFTWPEGATAWGLFLTLLLIAWQSVETRDAAQAALLNAQVLINSERPWIMVTVEEVVGPMGGFQLYMTNKGRTPAMVSGAYMGCVVVKDILALPDKAPYPRGSMAKDRIILPDEKLSLTWFGGGALKKLVGETFSNAPSEGDIFVFGKIIYKDLLDPFPAKPHETRWIGIYQLPMGESSDSIFSFQGIGAPSEYDHYS